MKTQTTLETNCHGGFTLIELMVTVAVIAILAGIAYPSYTNQVRKSRRTEAKTALLDIAGREERLYTTNHTYSSTPSDLGYSVTPDSTPMTVGSGYYRITISNISAGPPATYTLVATPVGAQASDTECASFTVTQTGNQTSTGTGAACW
jgi:type IV pilus assembly protein PilE